MIALAFILVAGGWLLLYSGITNRDPREELAAALKGSHAPERGGSQSDSVSSQVPAKIIGTETLSANMDIVTIGKKLEKMGYKVSEHPAFGGVHPVHAPLSYHYTAQALDVNAEGMPGGEVAALNALEPLLAATNPIELLWHEAGHYDHLHVAWGKRR